MVFEVTTGHFEQNCFIIIVTASKKNTNQKTAKFTANIYYGKSQRSFTQRNLKSSQTPSKQLQRTFKGQVLFPAPSLEQKITSCLSED